MSKLDKKILENVGLLSKLMEKNDLSELDISDGKFTYRLKKKNHELKKTIIHIFNSKFCLDEKKIENLPIGLFGDFYSHELSFVLINKNDYRNLTNIFNKCNLRIKKTFIKNFIKGVSLSENYKNILTIIRYGIVRLEPARPETGIKIEFEASSECIRVHAAFEL